MTTHSFGLAIDTFWQHLPEGHPLFDINPKAASSPDECYLSAGQAIVDQCEQDGAVLYAPLAKPADQKAWLRLVAAWVFWHRKCKVHESRASVAVKLNIDPSNLTNFLNGKRGLTTKALFSLAPYLGVQPFDIRPEMGADKAYAMRRKSMRQMTCVRTSLKELEQDILALLASGVPVEGLVKKVGSVMSALN